MFSGGHFMGYSDNQMMLTLTVMMIMMYINRHASTYNITDKNICITKKYLHYDVKYSSFYLFKIMLCIYLKNISYKFYFKVSLFTSGNM